MLAMLLDPSTWFSGHSHFSSNPLHSISCHLRQTCSGNTWSGLHHLRLLASLHTGIYTEKSTVNLEAASYIVIICTHTPSTHIHTHTQGWLSCCLPRWLWVCAVSLLFRRHRLQSISQAREQGRATNHSSHSTLCDSHTMNDGEI